MSFFNIFNKSKPKSDLEKQIELDGVEHAIRRLTEVTLNKIGSKEIAYQFILEELEGASMGNSLSKDFAKTSGINPIEYKGAMDNSMIEVDGPEGPQQFLRYIGMQLSEPLRVQVSLAVVDGVMKKFSLGKYKGQKISVDQNLFLKEIGVNVLAIISNDEVIYINKESNQLYEIDSDGDAKLIGRSANMILIDQTTDTRLETFVAFDEEESYALFTAKIGMQERFNSLIQNLYGFYAKNMPTLLNATSNYASQYVYTYRVYKKDGSLLFLNNSDQGVVINNDEILRGSGDQMKTIFW
jgi:hypothetical protein